MQELSVGDPSPDFSFVDFLKGPPIWERRSGIIYVLEFWASWCGPCQASIKVLSDLQEKYSDIVVIGVVAREKDLDQEKAFVAARNGEIKYRIALQTRSIDQFGVPRGRMTIDWLDASFSGGIPQTFLVDAAGRVAWIGHPHFLGEQIAALRSGSLDIDRAARTYREKAAEMKLGERFRVGIALNHAVDTGDNAPFYDALEEVCAKHPEIEREFGSHKLRLLLMEGPEKKGEALAYLSRLRAGFVEHPDILANAGIIILSTITKFADKFGDAYTEECTKYAISILEEIEPLKDGKRPQIWNYTFNSSLASGFLRLGDCKSALDRATMALAIGHEAGLSREDLSFVEGIVGRCEHLLSYVENSK